MEAKGGGTRSSMQGAAFHTSMQACASSDSDPVATQGPRALSREQRCEMAKRREGTSRAGLWRAVNQVHRMRPVLIDELRHDRAGRGCVKRRRALAARVGANGGSEGGGVVRGEERRVALRCHTITIDVGPEPRGRRGGVWVCVGLSAPGGRVSQRGAPRIARRYWAACRHHALHCQWPCSREVLHGACRPARRFLNSSSLAPPTAAPPQRLRKGATGFTTRLDECARPEPCGRHLACRRAHCGCRAERLFRRSTLLVRGAAAGSSLHIE